MTVLTIVSPLSCQLLQFQPADVGRYQGPGQFSMSPLNKGVNETRTQDSEGRLLTYLTQESIKTNSG